MSMIFFDTVMVTELRLTIDLLRLTEVLKMKSKERERGAL